MTPTLDPEYRKMLSTPAPLGGSRKEMFDSLQKQVDFYVGEATRLRYTQNSHVPISQLPAELLSDAFLYVVETGIREDHASFVVGTFAFLQVCRRWNAIAVGFPKLWAWCIPGALKAWDLFKSRSLDAPLFLTWRIDIPESIRNFLTNTETPRMIRHLNFSGTSEQLERLLSAIDSRSTLIISSIRLQNDGDSDSESSDNGDSDSNDSDSNDSDSDDSDDGDSDNGDPDNGDTDNGDPDNGDPDNGDPDNGDPDNGDPDNGDSGDSDSSPNSNGDSDTNNDKGSKPNDNEEYLTRFFSFSFPKLLQLDLDTFLPDSTSSIFASSNLTSLKLNLHRDDKRRYTRAEFFQLLQGHPNLQRLDLEADGLPPVEKSRATPIVFSQLVDLRLGGTSEVITAFMGLVSLSSPLHNVVIDFESYWNSGGLRGLKKFLTVYYKCGGLDQPRKADHLFASSKSLQDNPVSIESRSSPASHPSYNCKVRLQRDELAGLVVPFFPLEHVREYTTEGLGLDEDDWSRALQEMKGLLHLRLDGIDVEPMLKAFNSDGGDQLVAPKLQSLSFRNVDLLHRTNNRLLDLVWDRKHYNELKTLAVRSCRVPSYEYKTKLEDKLDEVIWENVTESGSEYGEEEEEEEEEQQGILVGWDPRKGYF